MVFYILSCNFAVMETTIILVRHGETVDNARQIMQGQTQGELNDKGRDQARQVAQRLACEQLDAVVASDLRRAIQTAEIIATLHGMTVQTTPLLRERDWGGFTGRFIPELKGEVWPEDIESEEALLERASVLPLQKYRKPYTLQELMKGWQETFPTSSSLWASMIRGWHFPT